MPLQPMPPIDYAPPAPWHRRRTLRRWVLAAALVGAVVSVAWLWGPAARRRARLLWAQHQCLSHSAPPGQVVYATDPDPDPFARVEARATKAPPPDCWAVFGATIPPAEAFPEDGDGWMDGTFEPLAPAPAPAFMHSRSAGGTRRLVVVEFGQQMLGGKAHRVLCARVIAPAGWRRDPVVLRERSEIVASSFEWTAAVRVFAGQADDADPSHFSVRTEVDGRPRTIDGWLQPDDSVKLEVRDEPAARP